MDEYLARYRFTLLHPDHRTCVTHMPDPTPCAGPCTYCHVNADVARRRAGGMTEAQRARVLEGRVVHLDGATCVLDDGRVMAAGETWRYRSPVGVSTKVHRLLRVGGRPGFNGHGEPMAFFITQDDPYAGLTFDAILSDPASSWERVA